nr:nicotinamide-nucleotide amidohydrolase family protein [Bacilli bacterium]
ETARIVVVGDNELALKQEIKAFQNSTMDILITTGGLGPTHDDLTKEVLVDCLNLKMTVNKQAENLLKDYFGNNMAPCNQKQAYFPKEALIIENHLGTADGAIIEQDGKIYIVLVGPPYEMNPMVIDSVIPYLKTKTNMVIQAKDYLVMGNGESFFEELLKPLISQTPYVSISPYASLGKIRYQIVGTGNFQEAFLEINRQFKELMQDYIISEQNEEIEEVLVALLRKRNLTIAFGESCTGGMLAAKLINVPHASDVIKESFVVYSNEAKIKYLHVNEATITQYGAVSEQTIEQMLNGLFLETKAQVCVAVSGIAGPSGGSSEKPVGLVYYGIKINNQQIIEHRHFKGNREMVRQRTTLFVLFRLWQLLK